MGPLWKPTGSQTPPTPPLQERARPGSATRARGLERQCPRWCSISPLRHGLEDLAVLLPGSREAHGAGGTLGADLPQIWKWCSSRTWREALRCPLYRGRNGLRSWSEATQCRAENGRQLVLQTRKQVERRPVSAHHRAWLLPPESQTREGPFDRPEHAHAELHTQHNHRCLRQPGGHTGGGPMSQVRRRRLGGSGSDGTCSASPSKDVAEPGTAPSGTPNCSPVTHRPHLTHPSPPPRIPPALAHAHIPQVRELPRCWPVPPRWPVE